MIRQWKRWEDSVAKMNDPEAGKSSIVTDVQEHDFIKNRFQGMGKNSYILGLVVIPILRAGLALAEHASSILPATKTYHLG
ncbi:hypothetical protein LINPERHAP1_LOCUS10413 [Linum perenne]